MNLRILLPLGICRKSQCIARRRRHDRWIIRSAAPPARLCCRPCPGILTYEAKDCGTVYVGIDQGVLVKAGAQVTVSVRRATGGSDLGQLKDAVERDFLKLDEQERNVRTAVAKMEGSLMGVWRSLKMTDERGEPTPCCRQ